MTFIGHRTKVRNKITRILISIIYEQIKSAAASLLISISESSV